MSKFGETRERQRLRTPLVALRAALAEISASAAPVSPERIPLSQARGAFAAEDVFCGADLPPHDLALLDGAAAASADLVGAGPMSPAFLFARPQTLGVGDPLPEGSDCVIDDSLVRESGHAFEVEGARAPGDGVRRAGEDLPAGARILTAGSRIRPLEVFALERAGVENVSSRSPRLAVVAIPGPRGEVATARLIGELADTCGARVSFVEAPSRYAKDIARALDSVAADILVTVGGAGQGPGDETAIGLARRGRLLAHGLAMQPGGACGLGLLDDTPALILPGRFDSALAGWLALGAPLLRARAGARAPKPLPSRPLARKIASPVGLAEIVLLTSEGGQDGAELWTPCAAGDLTLAAMLAAEGYLVIGEDSEGAPAGASIAPSPLPVRAERWP